ncbi:sigma factor-like helix-turn-helix DNA-binding protein [Actinomadura luteofluorescens]|uniref:sigma factor-like helix-turn-helix DNA-binding protein n=1 Tax=Actinomadura luteofluorescens TaxID=46163 RepID=UPI003635B101
MAFLVVLESMTPAERVALILHDVFRYPFAEIAEITGRTPAACRELASSGRRRIRAEHAARGPGAGRADVVRNFRRALETGDVDALIGLLDPGAVLTADGGGVVKTVLRPIEGGERIAHAIADLLRRVSGVTLLERTVNGQPGLIAQQDGAIVTVYAFEITDGRIRRIWAVRNPEKLRSWTGV